MTKPATSLEGRIVLVTGALGTIGRATTTAVAELGGTVLRSDLPGAGAADIALDVTSEEQWIAAVDRIMRDHGRLDGLVNAAGIVLVGDVERTSYADWRRVQSVNVDGTFLGCKHAMPLLAKSAAPSIVNISSISGIVAGPNLAAYNASKGAVRMLTKSVALSGARKQPQVRCNSVHPAFVEGEMVGSILATTRDPARSRERLLADVPLGRMARPEEVAASIVWLLSDASAFVTGSELVVDGGLVAR
jgi:NAD(P)-dependent dehydrogenase (short-subunit alcohol dehydrogenase family)